MPSSWRPPPGRPGLRREQRSRPVDPRQDAAVLTSKIDEIQANVQVGSCLVAASKTDDLLADINNLPSSVNQSVRNALVSGANNLKGLLENPDQCQGRATTSETTTSSPTTMHRADDHHKHETDHHHPHPDPGDDDHPDADDTPPPTTGGSRRDRTRGSMSARSPKGELISDRYRIEDRLGSGGMSSVFRATDTSSSARSR